MNDRYFDTLKERFIWYAGRVSDCADDRDINRSHVNYGVTTAFSQVLEDMGHKTDIPVWEDENGCLRIPYITLDGEELIRFDNVPEQSEQAENKAKFIQALGQAMHDYAYRTNVMKSDYVQSGGEEYAMLTLSDGSEKSIRITGDSCLAIMYDIYRKLW